MSPACDFLPLRALHVQHRGLQHAAERRRLFGLALLAASGLLDRLVEVRVELAPQLGKVGAAGREDALAVGVVRERVEQVLEREVGVPARDGFAERDVENDFERRRRTRDTLEAAIRTQHESPSTASPQSPRPQTLRAPRTSRSPEPSQPPLPSPP